MTWLWVAWLACASSPAPDGTAGPEAVAAAPVAPAVLPDGWEERVVGEAAPDAPLPMVVMVHGLGDRPQSMLRLLADLPGPARVIAPRAPDRWNSGWSWFPTRTTGDEATLSRQIATVAGQFVEDLEEARRARPTQGKPILAGFSQGGMLSFAVAVRHPDAIAGAVPVAGWLPSLLLPPGGPPAAAPPIRALHGEEDGVLPFARTQEGVTSLRAKGWDVTLQPFPGVAHRIPPPVRQELFHALQGLVETAGRKTAP